LKTKKFLLIAIYSHPDYYPPTLSAVENLSSSYDKIFILHRNVHGLGWKYPSNVELLASGNQFSVHELESAGFLKKMVWYLAFTRKMFWTFRKYKPDTFLISDYLCILAYRLISPFVHKPRVLWYHNHDVAEEKYIKRYSLSWLSWKSEKWLFPKLQIFSLPAVERKVCFPMNLLNGMFFFLPNFPSVLIYKSGIDEDKINNSVYRILFQGSIGPLHGLEELIPLLKEKISGKELRLVLKGFIRTDYLDQLKAIACTHEVADRLSYIGPTNYLEVIENARTCHIGIGIHKKTDVMNKTLGTASNKIYEYAALGLPVVLYDNDHFRETLEQYKWAFFTNTEPESFRECLQRIISDYSSLSKQAFEDFSSKLSYEHYFEPVKKILDGSPSAL
jgi:glycosyltransferase involved in cell wall biosynthesis